MRRIFFVRGARIDATEGPLELTFENGEVRLFGVGSNGETLVIDREPWADPFSGRVSAENEEFIVESGKWEAFDLGGLWSYGRFIGRCLTSVERTGDNSLRLAFGELLLDVESAYDELKVEFPPV